MQNDPERLFKRLNDIITCQPNWERVLAPRILLGLWHPKFIEPAKRCLPFCRRSFIGFSIQVARKYFWNYCDAFSVWFTALASAEGQKYVVFFLLLLLLRVPPPSPRVQPFCFCQRRTHDGF